jgi:hypothetical protein
MWRSEGRRVEVLLCGRAALGGRRKQATLSAIPWEHGQLGISLTFPPPFFSYSPTGSTWLRHGVQFCQYQAYVLRLETYYGLRRR